MTVTIGQRRTVVSWWIFHQCIESYGPTDMPEHYYPLIEEAEENLEKCDRILAQEHEDYSPQF